jgi:hypothetical protein
MIFLIVRHIVDVIPYNNPEIFLRCMFAHLFEAVNTVRHTFVELMEKNGKIAGNF